jgi:Holliday junction DNA helicase RuvA
MICQLKGAVDAVQGSSMTLDVSGVGYELHCTRACIERFPIGAAAVVVVYTDVKQDAIRLFGFVDQLEKQAFLLLMRVKGIGAKSAAEVISRIEARALLRTIASGDVAQLQRIRGIGKKTAERIVVELKDKVGEFILLRPESSLEIEVSREAPQEEALMALVALGFPQREAELALSQVLKSQGAKALDSSVLVKEALRFV